VFTITVSIKTLTNQVKGPQKTKQDRISRHTDSFNLVNYIWCQLKVTGYKVCRKDGWQYVWDQYVV